jgi:hypothetical protein
VEEKPMKKIFLFLSGIKGYDKDPEFKEISDEANRLVRSLIQQKEVWFILEGIDQLSNFLEQVVLNKKGDVQQTPPPPRTNQFSRSKTLICVLIGRNI